MFKQLMKSLRPVDPEHNKVNDALTATVSQARQNNEVAAKRLSDTLNVVISGEKCPLLKLIPH